MSQAKFEEIRATFPWTERVIQTTRGGLVQMIDRNGEEVPLFVMTQFLEAVTNRMAPKPEENKEAA